MPRKPSGDKLEKVISTKISADDFALLEKYARIQYNSGIIVQPTISHVLRRFIKNWANVVRDMESKSKGLVKPCQKKPHGYEDLMAVEFDALNLRID